MPITSFWIRTPFNPQTRRSRYASSRTKWLFHSQSWFQNRFGLIMGNQKLFQLNERLNSNSNSAGLIRYASTPISAKKRSNFMVRLDVIRKKNIPTCTIWLGIPSLPSIFSSTWPTSVRIVSFRSKTATRTEPCARRTVKVHRTCAKPAVNTRDLDPKILQK